MCVFSVSDRALHGHPRIRPVCPPDISRKSLALYYYTNGRPESERAPAHRTIFHSRPESSDPTRLRLLANDLTPPLLARRARSFVTGWCRSECGSQTGVLALEFLETLRVIRLHALVLSEPAMPRRLRDLGVPHTSSSSAPPARSLLPSASLGMI